MTERWMPRFFIGLCALSIASPLLWWPFQSQSVGDKENRRLTERPELLRTIRESSTIARGLRQYTRSFDTYFDDNFPFRASLVELHNYLKADVFAVDPIPGKTVKGSHGWYFLGDDYGKVVKETCGLIVFSDQEVQVIDSVIDRNAAWCDSMGIEYRLAIVRDKNSAYGDLLGLPARSRPTKYEQVRRLLAGDHAVVDMNGGFDEQRRQGVRLYHRTDSHWNDLGAFTGYRTLMRSLLPSTAVEHILERADVRIDTLPGEAGDLVQLLGQRTPEQEVAASIIQPIQSTLVPAELPEPPGDYPYQYEHRYRNPTKRSKILIFHDSFCLALSPYISETFGEVVMVWGSRLDRDVVLREQPDIVITELVERNLDELLPNYRGTR